MTDLDTKTRILDTAERLFADEGFAPVSLRMITGEADVNLAAVHYHFGSKDKLIEGVLARLAGPINEERLRILGEIEERAGSEPPDLKNVLNAFFEPPFRMREDPRFRSGRLVRLLGRAHADPRENLQEIVRAIFTGILMRFSATLCRCLPDLPASEVVLRMQFGIGSMVFPLVHPEGAHAGHFGSVEPPGHEETVQKLVNFVAAGMRAPAWKEGSSIEGDES